MDYTYIEQMDFSRLIARLTVPELSTDIDPLFSVEVCEQMVARYRQFHKLMLIHPNEKVTPTVAIDIIWHYHILDTRRYWDDCIAIHGIYIHHTPSYADGAGARTQDNTRRLFKKAFGESIEISGESHD